MVLHNNFIIIKSIVGKYYDQLYANKSDNLSETDKLLKRQQLSKLTQGETETLHRPSPSKEIE